MRYYLPSFRMAIIKKDKMNVGKTVEKILGIQNGIAIMENDMVVPQKFKNRTTSDPTCRYLFKANIIITLR